MKRKQLFIIILVALCLVLTLLFGAVSHYVTSGNVEDTHEGDNIASEDELGEAVPAISVVRTGLPEERELRGVWISSVGNIDFPSAPGLDKPQLEKEIDEIVENCREAGFNAIFFQVRPASDALYRSEIFPVSANIVENQGESLPDGFDPLAYFIKKAHENGIELHAWINPFRITTGNSNTYESDVNALSKTNPAVINKQWTVKYDDGKLYYDPGIPEVRELVISGVAEIVRNYDVDGIHLDDYFYPYPIYTTDKKGNKTAAQFKDGYSYDKYGNGMPLDDWRRENVNTFIKTLRDTVKGIKSDCRFGISCTGIWANASSVEGGSDTEGLQSYSETFADSKKWIESGYVDYICPQIYWEMKHKTAPFDVLCKWWSSAVDGTDVDLYIGHALYKNDIWSDKTEIMRQIEFARSWYGYKGSVLYGYSQIKDNKDGMKDRISTVFYEDYYHPEVPSTGESVTIGSPNVDNYVKAGNTYLLGSSDPAYPLYCNGQKIPRTQNGYFNMYVTVNEGENNFNFTQNGKETVITLKTSPGTTSKKEPVPMDGIDIINIYPTSDIISTPGAEIELSCTAPAGSAVTVSLGGTNVTLKPQNDVKTDPKYLPQVYKGKIKLPESPEQNELTRLGKLVFEAKLSGESVSCAASDVTLKPDNCNVYAEVTVDYTYLKKSPSSSFYDDYLPSSVGMRDYIESLSDGYYKLRFGGYIAQENAKIVEAVLNEGKITGIESRSDEKSTVFSITASENIPLDAGCEEGTFKITLFNASQDSSVVPEICENPLFSAVTWEISDGMVIYNLKLKNSNNYYGFNYEYVDGAIVFTFRNPIRIPDNDKPLDGITVIVDPGHGGTDVGALGFVSKGDSAMNEKDLNLLTATAAARHLEKLGATVIMTRVDDTTVELSARTQFVDDTEADLCISVHHNSLDYTTNITRVRGFLGLWWDDSGSLLAKTLSSTVTKTLSRYERTAAAQKLAMCRNHKYPSALLEMAFMTSAEEYESITDPANIDLAGAAIANGVVEYYKAQEKYL